ncbi:MAG TPA: S8 family serine peptidase [Longimicrobiales bacterium]|nr:S8 family serine peptidase [Longimicrobiales bacterium]
MKRATPLLLAALVGLGACSESTGIRQLPPTTPRPSLDEIASDAEFVPGQIIVRFTPGAARSEVAQAHRAKKKDDMLLARTEILEVPVGEELAIAAQMSKNPNVEFAEPDYITRIGPCEVSVACLLPDGSFFNFKWDLYNVGTFVDPGFAPGTLVTTGKADADIDWAELYDNLGPNPTGSAVIGILDTGIRATHQQFLQGAVNKVIGGQRFLGDGQPLTNVTDDHGHGTHVAGIAAGLRTAAAAGVAYGANIKLLIGKVCNAAGSCPNSATANGIVWAADNGANVINMSLGAFGGNPDGTGSAAQQAALQYAISKNVLPVCATGNDDGKVNYFGGVGYPARFPECMAVAATNWSDKKASYSNYGAQVAVSAPGGDGERSPYSLIFAAHPASNTQYTWRAGTSMATPQVAGLAALLYASGMTSQSAVRQRIINTSDDIETAGWDAKTGAGRINVYRAVTGLEPNAPPVVNPGGPYAGSEGSPVAFDASTSFDPNGKPVKWSWAFGDGGNSLLAAPSHTYVDNGTYNVLVTVFDAANLARGVALPTKISNVAPSVSGSLNTTSINSNESVSFSGAFTDPGVLDSPWSWSVNWGNGSSGAVATSQLPPVGASHQYCTPGTYNVGFSVTDKDGGTGNASIGTVQVSARGISISMPAAVNNNNLSNGNLPVTVYGSASFSVASVNLNAVTLGSGTPVQKKPNGTWMSSTEDANGDGYPDLVLHFSRSSLVAAGDLAVGTTQLALSAVLGDGCSAFAGSATIKVVP